MKFTVTSLAVVLALAFSLPALAATAKPAKPMHPAAKHHYYVAKAAKSKKCEVVTKKPDGKSATMVGKYYYKSEADAHNALKRYKTCH